VGKEQAYRTTLAHLSDDKSLKVKGSYGTAFRYPSFYEMYYVFGHHPKFRDGMKAETSKGIDFGFEKAIPELNLNIDLTYFKTKYVDALEGWAGNTAFQKWGGTTNVSSDTIARGYELITSWKTSDLLDFDLNYTYTSTYDGAEFDNPDLLTDNEDPKMVRVPRHFLNLVTNYKWPDTNLDLSLRTKFSSSATDYGNANTPSFNTFKKVYLDAYLVHDLSLNYNLFGYNVYLDVNNLYDKEYETSLDYASMERSFNLGFKRSY
jgi:vitamin B12 transporter